MRYVGFHLFRDARSTACEKGLFAVEEDLHQFLIRSQGKEREKLITFYNSVQPGRCPGRSPCSPWTARQAVGRGLGATEGNVDKQIAQRMKTTRCELAYSRRQKR